MLLVMGKPDKAYAQQENPTKTNNTYEAKVVEILNETSFEQLDGTYTSQEIRLYVEDLEEEKEVVTLNNVAPGSGKALYKAGDDVILLEGFQGENRVFYITDYNRKTPIAWVGAVFIIVVLAVTLKWGLYSIIGMFYSFFIIFNFILPQISKGMNPLTVALLGSVMIAPVTFILSHGYNKKTQTAMMGTFFALGITGALAVIFTRAAHLTGFGAEEALFLQVRQSSVNIKGIYLAGIIIGTLGILDDVTVSQAAIVKQLKIANKSLKKWELYKMAMDVGHDHISSAVNTLILVYAGAAMPMLLLFINTDLSYADVINYPVIAEEIVRTLVSSIGLVLAVPITTLLAVNIMDEIEDPNDHSHGHAHHHH